MRAIKNAATVTVIALAACAFLGVVVGAGKQVIYAATQFQAPSFHEADE